MKSKDQKTEIDRNNRMLGDLASFNTNSNLEKYAQANQQYYRAYSGITNSKGEVVQKGLKHIHKHKVNRNYEYSNKKSNAGFTAEIDEVAKTNANLILEGKKERIARSNDVGRGNDMVYDLVYTDESGNVLQGKNGEVFGYQMKVLGRFDGDNIIGGKKLPKDPMERKKVIEKSYDEVINKLSNPKNERYLSAGIAVGAEEYAYMKRKCVSNYEELMKQATYMKKQGKYEEAQKLQDKAIRTKKLGDTLVRAKDTSKEAALSYLHPRAETAKRIVKTSMKAGKEQAMYGAVMASVSTGINNIVAYSKGDIDLEEAVKKTAVQTVKSTSVAFVAGSTNAMVKGYLLNTNKQSLQRLAKSNMPMRIAMMTKEFGGSVKQLVCGEIDANQFLQEIGTQEAGMLASGWGAAVAASAAATVTDSMLLTAAAGAAGSTIALLIFSSLYQAAMDIYAQEQYSEERLNAIKAFCSQAKKQIMEEEIKLQETINTFYGNRQAVFEDCIQELDRSFQLNEPTRFVEALSNIAIEMGSCLQFQNFAEFNDFMMNDSLSLEF